ncbi:MAG: response regulator [Vallitaleaceae bacterium]|nr:response regulator [Vallitaleaceae bacterium]
MMLQIHGFKNVVSTTDPEAVVHMYETYQPDIILLDLSMPIMDGFMVMDELNKMKGDDYLPILIITARQDLQSKLKALSMGAKDFVTKPFENAEVIARIRNMLELRILHKEIKSYNRDLEKIVEERVREAEELQYELIERLLLAAEFRDRQTGGHIRRIGRYVEQMAKLMGYTDKDAKCMGLASMMHDVGKIGISDEILMKKGELSAEEWVIMREHTMKGHKLLEGSQSVVLQIGDKIAISHHEKWDGSGYPYGLKGDDIPIEGRITALFDIVDALGSKRSYKDKWEFSEVIKEIKKISGRHLDPALVQVFMENIEEFREIIENGQKEEVYEK